MFLRTGFADVPQDTGMEIHLRDDCQSSIPRKCRAYPLKTKNREVVEAIISGLVQDSKILEARSKVPFSFPMFIVWREDKPRMVIDIRALNKVALWDAYPMRGLDDILQMMVLCLSTDIGESTRTHIDAHSNHAHNTRCRGDGLPWQQINHPCSHWSHQFT